MAGGVLGEPTNAFTGVNAADQSRGTNLKGFGDARNSRLTSRISQITALSEQEPYGLNYTAVGVFQGPVHWYPYPDLPCN